MEEAAAGKVTVAAVVEIDPGRRKQIQQRFRNATVYADWREMLDKEAEHIDAVVVGTPDHSHAPAAAMALRLKKHVYCEKPLTHTVLEARTLAELASKNKLVTQLGTQIHAGDNYRRVVELVQGNAIGPIREAHVWSSAVYTGGTFKSAPQPANTHRELLMLAKLRIFGLSKEGVRY